MSSFYALRYLPGTPLKDRKHKDTLGRFDSHAEADDARQECPDPQRGLLEVVVRGGDR